MTNGSEGAGRAAETASTFPKDGLPTWAKITVPIATAVIGSLATLVPSLYKISIEQKNAQAAQRNAQTAQEQVRKLETQPGKPALIEGRYEWQWAKDAAKGYVYIAEDGAVRVEMSRYLNCGGSLKTVRLLEQKGNAKAFLDSNGEKLKVQIPVQFLKYDANCNSIGAELPTVLSGELDRKVAYAGKIEYQNPYSSPLGDMVLVKYTSGDYQ